MSLELIVKTPLTLKALEIATMAHRGQTRNDKKTPFITHPIAVANGAVELYDKEATWEAGGNVDQECEYLTVLGLAHDCEEDTPFTALWIVQELFRHDLIDSARAIELREDLDRLNKKKHDGYFKFTLAAKGRWTTAMVKRADIRHNSLTITKGSLKDKYDLALYILEY